MADARTSVRRTAYAMALVGAVAIAIAVVFKFGVRNEPALPFADAWNRGLVQGFILVNLVLIAIAIALLKLQPWARWAASFWGVLLAANALVTEAWHYDVVSAATVFEGVLIASVWGWFCYRQLFRPEVAALFASRNVASDSGA